VCVCKWEKVKKKLVKWRGVCHQGSCVLMKQNNIHCTFLSVYWYFSCFYHAKYILPRSTQNRTVVMSCTSKYIKYRIYFSVHSLGNLPFLPHNAVKYHCNDDQTLNISILQNVFFHLHCHLMGLSLWQTYTVYCIDGHD